uniref:GRF-type domain-containing protein n=1 Tax=Chenopodium quinoa TaxID=63459 RepID=A0A803MWB1_CHEQI
MAGGDRSFASGGSSSTSRSFSGLITKCNCGSDAVVRSVKKGPNVGRKIFGCPKWSDTNCNFLKWVDCNNEVDDLRFQIFEKDTTMAEMEYKRNDLQERVKKLVLKKEKLEDDVKEMKADICQLRVELLMSARNERHMSMALLFSWVLFGFVMFYLK